jgi:iron complex transport system substrate-binding protein
MKKKFILLIITISMLTATLLSGCGAGNLQKSGSSSGSASITVTDTLGRTVTLPSAAKRVVAVGPGALRLYCYAGSADKVVGIEQMDVSDATGKPYLLANPSLMKLSVIGPGGPNNAPDPEKILTAKPDVIFSTYATEKSAADELQSKTNIPVVVLSYGKTATFDPAVDTSLKLIGKTTGQEKKAQAVIDYIAACEKDLTNRTKSITDSDKPKVYVGGLGMKGVHGIESTQAKYSLLQVLNVNNVVDETGKNGSVMIDKEKLISWNPSLIFIDESGYDTVKQDYQKNASYYNSLTAFKKGDVYAQLPYNYYSTNIDTAIADAYYLGKVIYPDAFKDVDPEKKADEIYQKLLGKSLYSKMAKDFGGFKKLSF